MTARTLIVSLLAGSLAISGLVPRAASALTVYDPANFVQNLLSAIRQLQSNIAEAQQIQNQLQSLRNEARSLAGLSFSIEGPLTQDLQRLSEILSQTRGLVLDYAALQEAFDDLYPAPERYEGLSGADYARQAVQWRDQTFRAVNDAMRAQGIVSTQALTALDLTQLLGVSQGAEGHLQALQAGNQIAAMTVKQMLRLEQILSTASRAQSSVLAQQASDQAAGAANLRRALTDWGTATPSEPLTANPSLR